MKSPIVAYILHFMVFLPISFPSLNINAKRNKKKEIMKIKNKNPLFVVKIIKLLSK